MTASKLDIYGVYKSGRHYEQLSFEDYVTKFRNDHDNIDTIMLTFIGRSALESIPKSAETRMQIIDKMIEILNENIVLPTHTQEELDTVIVEQIKVRDHLQQIKDFSR